MSKANASVLHWDHKELLLLCRDLLGDKAFGKAHAKSSWLGNKLYTTLFAGGSAHRQHPACCMASQLTATSHIMLDWSNCCAHISSTWCGMLACPAGECRRTSMHTGRDIGGLCTCE